MVAHVQTLALALFASVRMIGLEHDAKTEVSILIESYL